MSYNESLMDYEEKKEEKKDKKDKTYEEKLKPEELNDEELKRYIKEYYEENKENKEDDGIDELPEDNEDEKREQVIRRRQQLDLHNKIIVNINKRLSTLLFDFAECSDLKNMREELEEYKNLKEYRNDLIDANKDLCCELFSFFR